jgi:pilus assembly protein Flp/PilA
MLSIIATIQTLGFTVKNRLRREETGATAVEYGIMVGLIAVVIIAVVVILGPQLAAMFQGVSDKLPEAPATSGSAG